MPGAVSRVKEPRTGQVSTCSRKSRFRTWGGDNTFIIKSSLQHHLLSEPQAFRRVYCATRVSGFSLVWVASFSTWQIEDKIARGGSLLPYPRSIACCSKRCRETFSFLYSHSLSLFFVPFSLSLSTISRVKDFNRRGYIIFTNCLQFFFFAQYNTFEYVFDIHHSLFIFVRNIYICIERRKCSDE